MWIQTIRLALVNLRIAFGGGVWAIRDRGVLHYSGERYYEAIADFTVVLNSFPREANTHLWRAEAHAANLHYEAAIGDYNVAIRAQPDSFEALLGRGMALVRTHENDLAVSDLTEAIELRPADSVCYEERAFAFAHSGRHDEAIRDATRALELDPTSCRARLARSAAYVQEGARGRAIEDATIAIEQAPTSYAYVTRSCALAALGRHQEAIADVNEALRLDPDCAMALSLRGVERSRFGQYEEAIQDCTKAIQLTPNSENFYLNRATACLFSGRYDRAMEDANKARTLTADEAFVQNALGYAQHGLGDYAAATQAFERAIALNAEHPHAHKNFAWLLATCPDAGYRNGVKAVEHATRAMELDGWQQLEWYRVLAAAHAECGDYAAALEWHHRGHAETNSPAPAALHRLKCLESRQPIRSTEPLRSELSLVVETT